MQLKSFPSPFRKRPRLLQVTAGPGNPDLCHILFLFIRNTQLFCLSNYSARPSHTELDGDVVITQHGIQSGRRKGCTYRSNLPLLENGCSPGQHPCGQCFLSCHYVARKDASMAKNLLHLYHMALCLRNNIKIAKKG